MIASAAHTCPQVIGTGSTCTTSSSGPDSNRLGVEQQQHGGDSATQSGVGAGEGLAQQRDAAGVGDRRSSGQLGARPHA